MKPIDKKKIKGKILHWRRELRKINRLGMIAQRELALKVKARDRVLKTIAKLQEQLNPQNEEWRRAEWTLNQQ